MLLVALRKTTWVLYSGRYLLGALRKLSVSAAIYIDLRILKTKIIMDKILNRGKKLHLRTCRATNNMVVSLTVRVRT